MPDITLWQGVCRKSYFMLDKIKVDKENIYLIDSTMKGNKKCTKK